MDNKDRRVSCATNRGVRIHQQFRFVEDTNRGKDEINLR